MIQFIDNCVSLFSDAVIENSNFSWMIFCQVTVILVCCHIHAKYWKPAKGLCRKIKLNQVKN